MGDRGEARPLPVDDNGSLGQTGIHLSPRDATAPVGAGQAGPGTRRGRLVGEAAIGYRSVARWLVGKVPVARVVVIDTNRRAEHARLRSVR
jgi:hypothetical protein